jgi:hypothetical protein
MDQAPTLAHLASRARQSQDCLQAVSALLPPAMRSGVQAGNLEEGQWCLLASNHAIAAKLRHLSPMLLAHLRTQGAPVQDIRIKIATR